MAKTMLAMGSAARGAAAVAMGVVSTIAVLSLWMVQR